MKIKENWCGYEFEGKGDKTLHLINCKERHLLIFIDKYDLKDMRQMQKYEFEHCLNYHPQFYGVDFILPFMAIVIDKEFLKIEEYFRLNEIVTCNVVELAKGQKLEPAQVWKDLHTISTR